MIQDNNNIPHGYKNSPLGVIPNDWNVKRVKDVLSYIGGGAFSSNDASLEGVRWLKIANVGINEIKWADESFLPDSFLNDYKDFVLCEGDIVLALTRPILDGKLKIAIIKSKDTPAMLNQRVAKVNVKDGNCKKFLFFNMQVPRFIYDMESDMLGTDPPNASFDSMYKQRMLLPPLAEQQRIAEVLNCWDVAIDKQDALAKALTRRKRALMQQLLTGKKRLPGFTGEWKKVRLGEVGTISSAGVDKKTVDGEMPVRLLNFLDVFRRDFLYSEQQDQWVTTKKDKITKCSVKKGDIFFTPSSETPNDIGISAVSMEDMENVVYSYHIVRFRLKENWDLKYRAYAFKTDEFYRQAQRLCDGSGQRYVISQNSFRSIEVTVPSIDEQKAIAEVLSKADREIEIAENKLIALRSQKQALMQQLLTGKKRLKLQ